MKQGRAQQRASRPMEAFTLMEVLIAVVILGMMGLTLYASFFLGFQMIDANRDELRATQILIQKTEAIRLCTWSQLTNFSFSEYYDPAGATNGRAGTLYRGAVITNAPSNIADSNAYKGDVRLITVTVYWTNYNGARQIVHSR